MRVAVFTGQLPHHKHLCLAVARRSELVGVIHPVSSSNGGIRSQARKLRREVARTGATQTALRVLGTAKTPLAGWNDAAAHDEAERRFFAGAEREFARLDPALVHRVADVNADSTIELVRGLRPDAVICLGGPIYRQPLIEACAPMLNFHSGVSPLYNGASTISFAFANGHPHLCGGTLMVMSPVVDGGDILAHYLPAVESDDTPATLFMKTTAGAAKTAAAFLDHLEHEGSYAKCPQTPPLFYYSSRDWTLHHSRCVSHHLAERTAARFARAEQTLDYWTAADDGEAAERLRLTLTALLRLT